MLCDVMLCRTSQYPPSDGFTFRDSATKKMAPRLVAASKLIFLPLNDHIWTF